MKNAKTIVALLLSLALLLPAMALAEADAARFGELVAANSMEARFARHGALQVVKSIYFEDGDVKTETHIMDPDSHYFVSQFGISDYMRPDLFIRNDSNDPAMILEYLYDSEEALRDIFSASIDGWTLGVADEELVELDEADGVVTARTTTTDPAVVDAVLAQCNNVPAWYESGRGMTLAYEYCFDAETGDLMKVSGEIVDAEGSAYLLCVDEYTFGVNAFDPAAGDSPFADFFAAPEGKVDITLHFMDDGTEMKYTVPHGTYFIVMHGDEPADSYIDEACTQPYEGGNQLDELTLYVK